MGHEKPYVPGEVAYILVASPLLSLMSLFTIDKGAFARGLLTPEQANIDSLILNAGNMKFVHHGYDEFGMPVISCDTKPLDSRVYGIIWIDKFTQA
jgi:hypothetical protein